MKVIPKELENLKHRVKVEKILEASIYKFKIKNTNKYR